MKKYTLEMFKTKFKNYRQIWCGIHYTDGTKDTFTGGSMSQLLGYISTVNKEVDYIISR